jgi:putative transposase
MAQRKVPFLPNHYYHIYNRGAHRIDIFRNDADYTFLLKLVKIQAERCAISVIAYSLMHNHYHFLLRQNSDIQISIFMQAIFNVYTKAFNSKYQLSGTLFEGPFRATHVDRTEYLLHLCRYIHRNPLDAQMVLLPEQWHYSNYLEFVDQRDGTLVDKKFVKDNFGSPEEYREFVMDYVPPEKTQKELRHYLFWD